MLKLLRHVDTIQELSVILVSDLANLGDLGAGQRQVLVVNTIEDHLILELWAHLAGAAWEHLDLLDLLSAQEVLDFNALSVLGDRNVDGEMGVYQSHFVSEPLNTIKY